MISAEHGTASGPERPVQESLTTPGPICPLSLEAGRRKKPETCFAADPECGVDTSPVGLRNGAAAVVMIEELATSG